MRIAKVIGTTISTIKDEKLTGPTDETGEVYGQPYVAVDTLDAGVGDLVLTAHGSGGRQTYLTRNSPVDAVIMAVIDHMEVSGEVVWRKGSI
jgi:microcompartment protein CcmK/EutM